MRRRGQFGFVPVGVRKQYYENVEDAIGDVAYEPPAPPEHPRLRHLCPGVGRIDPLGGGRRLDAAPGIETSGHETAAALVMVATTWRPARSAPRSTCTPSSVGLCRRSPAAPISTC